LQPGCAGHCLMSFLVQRFLSAALHNPKRPAVDLGGVCCTYGEFSAMVFRLARIFRRASSAPRVAICGGKVPATYAAMLAAMAAGGFYVPINREAVGRIQTALREIQPDLIFADEKAMAQIAALAPDACFVPFSAAQSDADGSPFELPPHRLAYVMYTSGSTGSPKGVMISQDALDHYTGWAISAMEMSPGDRMSQHPNIGFDLSVLDIYAALCSGATLVSLDGQLDRLFPARAIARHKLTVWNSVPSVMSLMLKSGDWTTENVRSLRLLTFCGEPLLPQHLEGIFNVLPDVIVHNTYGPTEATVSCSLLRLDNCNYGNYCENSVALGEPIEGTKFVIDGGDAGELLIGGSQLADGYWGDAERTAKAFVRITRGGETSVYYRTGDFVTRTAKGLFFLERRDNQVKIKGYRVELGEISARIRSAGFTNAATIVDGQMLVSFVEGNASDADLLGLRKQLAKVLDSHMMPAKLVALSQFPRNANDKIELNELKRIWEGLKGSRIS
jgi:D-alanine--poly(phosphoribitol) ligase subunit 1